MGFFTESTFSRLLKTPPIILLMGGPGSGKGVLAKSLTQFNHFSIGESLREITNDPLHPKAAMFLQWMQQGKLLEDDDVMSILNSSPALQQDKPLLLDGFPRTFNQWNKFKQLFVSPAAVIDLSVSIETMQKRLEKRQRKDDIKQAINYRINDYFDNTRPMADEILKETAESHLIIQADNLTPEEITAICVEYFKKRELYPEPKPDPLFQKEY